MSPRETRSVFCLLAAIATLAACVDGSRAIAPHGAPASPTLSIDDPLSCPSAFETVFLEKPEVGQEDPADRNADLIICRLDLSRDGDKKFVEIDNHLPFSQIGSCPDGAAGEKWLVGEPPDRNRNGIVCVAFKPDGEKRYFDDNHR